VNEYYAVLYKYRKTDRLHASVLFTRYQYQPHHIKATISDNFSDRKWTLSISHYYFLSEVCNFLGRVSDWAEEKGQRQGWLAGQQAERKRLAQAFKIETRSGSLCLKLHRAKNVCNRVKAQQKKWSWGGKKTEERDTSCYLSLSSVRMYIYSKPYRIPLSCSVIWETTAPHPKSYFPTSNLQNGR
jgi:hypothetical protein